MKYSKYFKGVLHNDGLPQLNAVGWARMMNIAALEYGITRLEKVKEIADMVGIEKTLTHHMARRTFATTVLLFNNVPMEVVSELLGHSKMATTQQSYGKIVQKKVGEEMRRLNKTLKP